jgi:hypothetical protein
MVLLPGCVCCQSGCEACIDIYKAVSVQAYADNKCHPTAGPECTITIPSEYSLPVTVRLSGVVDDDLKFNGNIVEPGQYIYADNCNGAHNIGTASGGPGYRDETADDQTFTLQLVDNFGIVSWMRLRVCIDPANTQGVCIPPTTDCPLPVPPNVQCCKRIANCGGVNISTCETVPADVCCKSYANGDDTVCDGTSPTYTSCESGGASPNASPPYDCVNGAFAFGAWVTVSGWSAYTGDTSGFSEDDIALLAETNAKVNRTFYVPFECFGSGQVTLDLGVGESRDTRDCSGAHWFATITVNLCHRTASVAVSNISCLDGTDIQIDLGELTAVSVPCNSWTGCMCEGYDDTIPILTPGGPGGGTVTVSSSV